MSSVTEFGISLKYHHNSRLPMHRQLPIGLGGTNFCSDMTWCFAAAGLFDLYSLYLNVQAVHPIHLIRYSTGDTYLGTVLYQKYLPTH